MDTKIYDALIVVTPNDFVRVECLYRRLLTFLPVRRLIFIGSKKVSELLEQYKINSNMEPDLLAKMDFICEDDILPFDDIHNVMKDVLSSVFTEELPRGITGWYYQQFLKMKYSSVCHDEYYMVWDGDTVPCKKFSMFKEGTDIPYLDLKTEYHEDYFDTIAKILPGMQKCIQKSFIAEHMLIKTDIMRNLINEIEKNEIISGEFFWERIIRSIQPAKLMSNSFSEFETYGTYVAYKYPSAYRLRDWHSFRYGGEFYEMSKISDDDFEWLGRDFFAISFEKNHFVREDHRNLFDNKEYQSKLSARQMLEIAQQEFGEGSYQEIW